MKSILGIATISICLLGAGGCTPARTSTSFSDSEAMRAQPVAFGQVVAIRAVDIRPGETRLGTVTGAVLGGIGGSQLGGGTAANVAGGVAGAVVGGAIGSAIQGSRNTPGIEVTVSIRDSGTVAIVQPGSINDFRVGDRVRVTGDSNNARVSR